MSITLIRNFELLIMLIYLIALISFHPDSENHET